MKIWKILIKKFNILFFFFLLFLFSFSLNVYASSSQTSYDTRSWSLNGSYEGPTISNNYVLMSDAIDDKYYEVELTLNATFNTTIPVRYYGMIFQLGDSLLYYQEIPNGSNGQSYLTSTQYSSTFKCILDGATLNGARLKCYSSIYTQSVTNYSVSINFSCNVNSYSVLNDSDSNSYQNGYNAGFSAGQDAGYSSGYNAGYSAGEASGSQSGYESGYQAGIDSVDTQSFYDSGYEAGFAAAYTSGYDDGYSSGYDDAMSRIAQWGADVSNYPILLVSGSKSNYSYSGFVDWYWPIDLIHNFNFGCDDTIIINPNHTYKFVVGFSGLNFSYNKETTYRPYWSGLKYFLDVNGTKYTLFNANSSTTIYVPGNLMSNSFDIGVIIYGLHSTNAQSVYANWLLDFDNLSVYIYDCGPTGDTQNHIANQTDQLMNTPTNNSDAFNSHQSDFSSAYDTAQATEDSFTSSAFNNVNSFDFFDPSSGSGMASALSFYSAVVTAGYTSLGDFKNLFIISLVIIVIMVLLRIRRDSS